MDQQHPPDDFLDACSPWLSLAPDADWLETCPNTAEPASPREPQLAAAEASDLSADTQERCLWTLAVVDSSTGKALRPVTPAEAQAVWVPQPTAGTSLLTRGDSLPEPFTQEPKQPEQVLSEEGSSPPSPGLLSRGLDSMDRQFSVASQLSKIGGPCQHCGVKESPQWRRGPINKPILCNACGTRYRRTHQFKHASDLVPDALPRTCSISSSQGTCTALRAAPSSLESPLGSLGTRSASLGTRSASLGPRSASLGTRSGSLASKSSSAGIPAQRDARKPARSASRGRKGRKRPLDELSQDEELCGDAAF